jgi:hypothetical protein
MPVYLLSGNSTSLACGLAPKPKGKRPRAPGPEQGASLTWVQALSQSPAIGLSGWVLTPKLHILTYRGQDTKTQGQLLGKMSHCDLLEPVDTCKAANALL